jgi:flagellar biosynthesis/type III secretory pathway protein FliH
LKNIYNGTKDLPPHTPLKLSDMRAPERKNIAPKLELTVDIYNINSGKRPDLLEKCRTLSEYETFVELVNTFKAKTGNLHDATEMTIAECKKRKILTKFIQTYASEIENMIFTQWNFEDAKAVWLEEGREEGREVGREEGREVGGNEVLALIEQGYSADEIRKMRSQKPMPRR